MTPLASPFIKLNNDVKRLIFGFLDGRALSRLRESCKHLKDLVDKSNDAWKKAFLRAYPDYPLPERAHWQKLYKDHSLLTKPKRNLKEIPCSWKIYDPGFLENDIKAMGIEGFNRSPAPIYRFYDDPRSIIHNDFVYIVTPCYAIEKRELISNHHVHTFKPPIAPIEWVFLKNNRLVILCNTRGSTSLAIWNTRSHIKLYEEHSASRPSQETLPPQIFSHVLYITSTYRLQGTQAVSTKFFDLESGACIGQRTSEVIKDKKFTHIVRDGCIFEGIDGEKWTLIDLRGDPSKQKHTILKTLTAIPKLLISKFPG